LMEQKQKAAEAEAAAPQAEGSEKTVDAEFKEV